jgi:hypothetical protein
MKILIKLSFVLALVLVTLQPYTTAQASSMSKFKGESAVAFFASVDGCIQTNVDLYTAEGMAKEGSGAPRPASSINIYISQYDTCSGTQILFVDAIADQPEPALQIDPKLGQASLHTTLNVTDTLSGTTFDIAIDMTWTGFGPLRHDQYNFRLDGQDCRIHDHNNLVERAITATGSVWSETQNFTPEPSVGGWLISTNSHFQYYSCN